MRAPPSFEKVTKNCEHCKKPVTKAPSLMKNFHFCSWDCRKAAKGVTRNCEHCGNAFRRPISQMRGSARFCSKACYDKAQTTGEREEFTCECCGDKFTRLKSQAPDSPRRFCSDACQRKVMVREKHPRWKGGRVKDVDGEELTRMFREGVASPYMRTHRKLVSEAIGRLLENHEHVLHINNNHDDHRLENLFICGSIKECVQRINGSLPWPTKSNVNTYK